MLPSPPSQNWDRWPVFVVWYRKGYVVIPSVAIDDADKRTYRLSICIPGRVEMRDYTVDSQSPPQNEFFRHHRPQYRCQSPIRPRPFAAKWNQNQPPWIFKGNLLSLLIHLRNCQTDFENKIWRSCANRFREMWKLNCNCRKFNKIDTEWVSRRKKNHELERMSLFPDTCLRHFCLQCSHPATNSGHPQFT